MCPKWPLHRAAPSPKRSKCTRVSGFSSVLGQRGHLCHFVHLSTGNPAHREEVACIPSLQMYSPQIPVSSFQAWPLCPSPSISHCWNQGTKPPGTRTCSITRTDGQRQGQAGKNKLHSLQVRNAAEKAADLCPARCLREERGKTRNNPCFEHSCCFGH